MEIYKPLNTKNIEVKFESDTPFMTVNKGDVLNPGLWSDSMYEGNVLKVVGIEHFIWELNNPTHKIAVYTEGMEDIAENRF